MLTLVKTVTNTSGGTAQPTDWLLSATGGVDDQGAGGRPAVTNAVRAGGSYALAEAGGPGGYTALGLELHRSDFERRRTTGTVTLAAGDAAHLHDQQQRPARPP